jgi:signal transduction histidine kinase
VPERRAARAGARGGRAGRLRQVLLILLDNALKHTSAGGTIAIAVQRQGSHAHVEVRDMGPGIAPRDLPHVFDRFYRADRERRDEGSGLGLAIASWIVETPGGRITARERSRPRSGLHRRPAPCTVRPGHRADAGCPPGRARRTVQVLPADVVHVADDKLAI